MEIREPKYNVGDKVVDNKVLEIGNPKSCVWEVKRISKYDFFTDLYIYELESDEDGISLISIEDNLKPYIEKPKNVWELQDGDTYYVVDYNDMNAFKIVFYNDEIDLNHMELGNCFLTKEEAESELERVKIEAEMIRLGGRRNIKICNDNYYIMYDNKTRNLAYFNRNWMHSQGSIFFDTYVDVDKAVKAIGEDRIKKYIFGVEE